MKQKISGPCGRPPRALLSVVAFACGRPAPPTLYTLDCNPHCGICKRALATPDAMAKQNQAGIFICFLLGIHLSEALRVNALGIKCMAGGFGKKSTSAESGKRSPSPGKKVKKSPLEQLAATDRTTTAPSFLSHPGWPKLQAELDQLPAFTCVNAEGAPLGYERDGQPLAIFFADIARAQQELEMAEEKYPELGLRIMGVGLGDVHARRAMGTALLVPAAEALAGAGDEWNSETLPLYTCLRMSSGHPDGSTRTPLFMDPKDAQASLDKALGTASQGQALSEAQKAQLSLVCTSLDQAVDMVLSGREKDACEAGRFSFVAPRSSLLFLQQQRGGGKSVIEKQRTEAASAIRDKQPLQDPSSMIFPS